MIHQKRGKEALDRDCEITQKNPNYLTNISDFSQ